MTDKEAALRALLDKAEAVLNDFADMERGGKAVSALVKAERDLAEFKAVNAAHAATMDEEGIRAELRRRLVAYAQADSDGASLEALEAIAMGTRVQ